MTVQVHDTTRHEEEFLGGVVSINDFAIVVFHQTIEKVQMTSTEDEQPG